MEVARIPRQHLANKAELVSPEFARGGGGEEVGTGLEKPEPVIPDPITFGVLQQEGKEELQVQMDDVEDLGLAAGVVEGGGLDLVGEGAEFVLVNAAAVVPDCVVLWVLLEER